MGLFHFMKGKQTEQPPAVSFPAVLGAPVSGTFVPMAEISDGVFSAGILGKCCGVEPSEGKFFAPIGGKISQLADTLHAVGLEGGGIEVLIHVGIDTVEMNGDGFASAVKIGQAVRKGDLLLTVDLDKVRKAGHPTTIIMVVTNTDDFSNVETAVSGTVQAGDNVLTINR